MGTAPCLLAAFSRPAACKCSATQNTTSDTSGDNAMGGEENKCDASSAMVFIV